MSLSWRQVVHYQVLDAKGANWVWNSISVKDFKNVSMLFATDGWGDAALVVKFQWSIWETAPDFSAAQSVTNMWDYVEVVDLNSGSAINWDTWITVATADDYRQLEFNTNGLTYINAIVSWRTAWEVTVAVTWFTNI